MQTEGPESRRQGWCRDKGRPAPERLDHAVQQVLEHSAPKRIVLFGSGARGELTPDSDLDLLVILAADDPADRRTTCCRISDAIGYQPRADVTLSRSSPTSARHARAWPGSCGQPSRKESRCTRTDAAPKYRPRPRPAPQHREEDPATAEQEGARLATAARVRLERAEWWRNQIASEPESDDWEHTEVAGAARKAIEFALQAAIVSAGRRPRAWKSPARLATEATEAGMTIPKIDSGALERAGVHYTGRVYPEYDGPPLEAADEALDLARRLVAWTETVSRGHASDARQPRETP